MGTIHRSCGVKPTRGAGGFTLIEVFIALTLVSLALMALLHLQVISIYLCDRAEHLSRAALIANAKMAEVLSVPFPEIGSDAGTEEEDDGIYTFHWEWTVSETELAELEELELAELRLVHVQVRWQEGSDERNVKLATFVAQKR